MFIITICHKNKKHKTIPLIKDLPDVKLSKLLAAIVILLFEIVL